MIVRRERKKQILQRIVLVFLTLLFISNIFILPASVVRADEGGIDTYASASYSRQGNLTLDLTIDKRELPLELQNKESFVSYVKNAMKQAALGAGKEDLIDIKKIEETSVGFNVKLRTRRLHTKTGMGTYERVRFSEYVGEGTETYMALTRWDKGNLKNSAYRPHFDGILSERVDIGREKQEPLQPMDAKTGNVVTLDEFCQAGASASKNTYFVSFFVPDLKIVKEVTVKLPGKVQYVASRGVEIVNENTIKISAISVKGTLLKEKYMDGDVDGVTDWETQVLNMDCFYGYVVFEHSVNWGLIIGIISFVVVALAVFLIWAIKTGRFVKFFGMKWVEATVTEEGISSQEGNTVEKKEVRNAREE